MPNGREIAEDVLDHLNDLVEIPEDVRPNLILEKQGDGLIWESAYILHQRDIHIAEELAEKAAQEGDVWVDVLTVAVAHEWGHFFTDDVAQSQTLNRVEDIQTLHELGLLEYSDVPMPNGEIADDAREFTTALFETMQMPPQRGATSRVGHDLGDSIAYGLTGMSREEFTDFLSELAAEHGVVYVPEATDEAILERLMELIEERGVEAVSENILAGADLDDLLSGMTLEAMKEEIHDRMDRDGDGSE
jgi:hypothetical protein